MFGFFRKLFGPSKVEVTINVPDVRIYISEDKSGSSDTEVRADKFDFTPMQDDQGSVVREKLEKLQESEKLEAFKATNIPEVPFGQEREETKGKK